MVNPNIYKHITALEEFEKELKYSSDRGIALICGSIIDYQLGDLLKSFLIKSASLDKDLFKGTAPLATFDSKLKLAFYLGLINEGEKRNITYIQRVRNRFAHQFLDISFENVDIKNLCSILEIPKNGFLPKHLPRVDKNSSELPKVDLNPIKKDTPSKERFILTFRYLYLALVDRTFLNQSLVQRSELKEVHTADKYVLNSLNDYESSQNQLINLLDQVNERIAQTLSYENTYPRILEELNSIKQQAEADIKKTHEEKQWLENIYTVVKNSLE